MAPLESVKDEPMSAVEINATLIRALQARAQGKDTVGRLARRLIAASLQELEEHEAVKAFRARPGRTVSLAVAKKRLGVASNQ